MKLYHVHPHSIIEAHGEKFYFYHVDGMYSFCKTMGGEVVHLAAWEDVEVHERFNPKELTFPKKRKKKTA